MIGYLNIILLLNVVSGGNILFCVTVPGSHMYAASAMAEMLGKAGHNVTLFSMADDVKEGVKNNEMFHYVGHPEVRMYNNSAGDTFEEMIKELIVTPTADMAINMFGYNEKVLRLHFNEIERGFNAFDHPLVDTILGSTEFDVIVVEQMAAVNVAAKAVKLKIRTPIVRFEPVVLVSDKRMAENMPMLLNSEQNMIVDLSNGKPAFTDRLRAVLHCIKLARFSMGLVNILKKRNIDINEVNTRFEMTFAAGHPALSFPFLTPPNYKYLGFSILSQYEPKPLPDTLVNFIDNCKDKYVIYTSFGSMLSDPLSISWIGKFFKLLLTNDVCVLFKAKPDFAAHFSLPQNRFYTQTWMPQKDILASGKPTIFISHCGNNGRLEAIFYGIPILCVPLFADQYRNALLVQQKQFGMLLTKEEIMADENAVRVTVDMMLRNRSRFANNMAVAKQTVLDDPGSGLEVFLFHIKHIITHDNANYLRNNLLLNQSTVEVYNLDIIIIALICALIIFGILLYVVVKVIKMIMTRVARKLKRE